jgi:hypothetical protein
VVFVLVIVVSVVAITFAIFAVPTITAIVVGFVVVFRVCIISIAFVRIVGVQDRLRFVFAIHIWVCVYFSFVAIIWSKMREWDMVVASRQVVEPKLAAVHDLVTGGDLRIARGLIRSQVLGVGRCSSVRNSARSSCGWGCLSDIEQLCRNGCLYRINGIFSIAVVGLLAVLWRKVSLCVSEDIRLSLFVRRGFVITKTRPLGHGRLRPRLSALTRHGLHFGEEIK